MSRAQDTAIYNTSTADNATNEKEAQDAESTASTGIGDYSTSVAKLAAKNPYVQGGEFATDQMQDLSDASNAGSKSLADNLAAIAKRTGQNPNAAIAGAESGAEDLTRSLGTQEADADAKRISSEAGYNQGVTEDTAKIPQLATSLYSTAGNLADNQENTARAASADNKSFGDTLGSTFAAGLGSGLAALAVPKLKPPVAGAGGGASPGDAYQGLDEAQGIAQNAGPADLEDPEKDTGLIAYN